MSAATLLTILEEGIDIMFQRIGMRTILSLSILLCAIAMPASAGLTDVDLDKIRLIVNEEIKKEITITNTKIDGLDTRLRNVETDIAELRGRRIAFSLIKDWLVVLCAVAALIVSIVALQKKQPTGSRQIKMS